MVTNDLPYSVYINVYWSKGYDAIISIYDVTNKFLSRDSNYIAEKTQVW